MLSKLHVRNFHNFNDKTCIDLQDQTTGSPIVTFIGDVDTGKTVIFDCITTANIFKLTEENQNNVQSLVPLLSASDIWSDVNSKAVLPSSIQKANKHEDSIFVAEVRNHDDVSEKLYFGIFSGEDEDVWLWNNTSDHSTAFLFWEEKTDVYMYMLYPQSNRVLKCFQGSKIPPEKELLDFIQYHVEACLQERGRGDLLPSTILERLPIILNTKINI